MSEELPRDLFRRVDRALVNPTRVTAWNGSTTRTSTVCVGDPNLERAIWTDDNDGVIFVEPDGTISFDVAHNCTVEFVPDEAGWLHAPGTTTLDEGRWFNMTMDDPDPQLYRMLADVVWVNANG